MAGSYSHGFNYPLPSYATTITITYLIITMNITSLSNLLYFELLPLISSLSLYLLSPLPLTYVPY